MHHFPLYDPVHHHFNRVIKQDQCEPEMRDVTLFDQFLRFFNLDNGSVEPIHSSRWYKSLP